MLNRFQEMMKGPIHTAHPWISIETRRQSSRQRSNCRDQIHKQVDRMSCCIILMTQEPEWVRSIRIHSSNRMTVISGEISCGPLDGGLFGCSLRSSNCPHTLDKSCELQRIDGDSGNLVKTDTMSRRRTMMTETKHDRNRHSDKTDVML